MSDDLYRGVVKSGLKLKKGGTKRKPTAARKPPASSADLAATTNTTEDNNQPIVEDEDIQKVLEMKSMTTTEKGFLLAQLKRRREKIEKGLERTHRERIAELNDHLGKLSEHFDVPKVGPG